MTRSENVGIAQKMTDEIQEASTSLAEPIVEDTDDACTEAIANEETPSEARRDTDYEQRARQDLQEIQALFPTLSYMTHLSELNNAARFAVLRDMGLTVEEAFMASNAMMIGNASHYDNRSHLRSSVPRGSFDGTSQMSRSEMEEAKAIFGNLSEREIRDLFKRAKG